MDVKGAVALKRRIEATADDDSRPDQRLLVNAVTFMFEEQKPGGTYGVLAMGSIDRHGHVSIDVGLPWGPTTPETRELMAERRTDATNALLDAELVEWQAVGSGDSELYATPALLERVAPALAAMPNGWQSW